MEKRFISSKDLFDAIAEQLAENRQAAFTITGMSMWPFLCHGRDQVTIENVEKQSLKIGDLVLFRVARDRYILHRITKLSADSFQTTGDGNLYRDMPMPYSSIVARVCEVVRKGKPISCSSRKWKLYSALWMRAFPIRKQLFRLWKFRNQIRKK